MKTNEGPNIRRIPIHMPKYSTTLFPPQNPQNCSHTERRMCLTVIKPNIWAICILMAPENIVQVFLLLLAKNTTKRPNKQRHLPHKPIHRVNRAVKHLSFKEPHLPRDLNPPKNQKDRNTHGRRINQLMKEKLA